MPVSHLEVENFKSYSGPQTIGPFKDFTCVVGPNGSGKSNLMDALSFVLGVSSKDLRSPQLQDLIFRAPGGRGDAPKLRASVTLVYVDTFEAGKQEETRFTREITPAGVAGYKLDGKKATWDQYEAALGEIGVLVKARNFLVFQGDVEGIARKSPQELVQMLEGISGSGEVKAEYERLKKAKEEAEAATIFAFNRQKGFRSERKQFKEQKDEADRFDLALEERAEVQTEFYLWQLFHIHTEIKEREATVGDLRSELKTSEAGEATAEKGLKELKKADTAKRRAAAGGEKQRVKLAGGVDAMQPEIIRGVEEVKALTQKVRRRGGGRAKRAQRGGRVR
jgi:structural maintenance of chromosome 1